MTQTTEKKKRLPLLNLNHHQRDQIYGIALLLPAILLVGFVVFYQVLDSVLMSFQDFRISRASNDRPWVGFANYIDIMKPGGEFWHALWVTFSFVFLIVGELMVFGLILAIYFNNVRHLNKLYQSLILLSWGTPIVIVALIWRWIFHSDYGVMNFILTRLHLVSEPVDWLMRSDTALHTVVIAALWRQLPFVFLLLLAGLQNIPKDIYEAASLDGVNERQSLFHITLPYLRNVLRGAILVSIITNFKLFPLFWTMTGGGPANDTETLAVLTYKNAFVNMNFSTGAAVATGWLVILVIFSIIYEKLFREADYI